MAGGRWTSDSESMPQADRGKADAPDGAAKNQRSFVPFFTKKDAAKNATIRMA